jgi:hypothetical protein
MPNEKKMFWEGVTWKHVTGIFMIIFGSFLTGYEATIDTTYLKVVLPLNVINLTGLVIFFLDFLKARFRR